MLIVLVEEEEKEGLDLMERVSALGLDP
jgi:hypothetical protein